MNNKDGNEDTNKIAKIMIIKGNKVLLLFSKKLRKFHLPGGHVQKNETFVQGLKREVKEETDLDLTNNHSIFYKKPNFVLYKGYTHPGYVKLSDEHDGYVWAKIDNVIEKYKNTLCNYTFRDLWHLQRYWKRKNSRKTNQDKSVEDIS